MDNCNCNINYDKIKKRIEECNKNIKHLYIQGPTGPVGPQGQDGIQGPTGPTETYKSVNNKFQIITITEIMVLFCSKLLPLSSHQFLFYL